MNYIGFNTCDTANGPGIRVSLFVAGCRLHCKGCFNQESWDFAAGKLYDADIKMKILCALNHPYIRGFSLLGGDPFEPEHKAQLTALLRTIKTAYPEKDIWVWTGRKLDHVKDSPLLQYIDYLVDGAFIEHLKDSHLMYRGSSNQKIWKCANGMYTDISAEYNKQ